MKNVSSSKNKLRGKNIVVTGGAGFIGSHLITRLIKEGANKIIAIDSMEYGKEENIPVNERVEVKKFKIGTDNIQRLAEYLYQCDYLFHLAAQKHNQSIKDPHAVYKTNILGTGDLFELAGKCGVKKVFFSSSLYAYGSMTYPPMAESQLPQPTTIYGISKLCGEQLLKHFANKYNYDAFIARYFFVYGPRQFSGTGYKSVIIKNLERLNKKEPLIIFGDGKQSLDYIYIDDVIDATLMLVRSDVSGEVFNIGSGKATTVYNLCKSMLKLVGDKGSVIYEPEDWTAHTNRVADISKITKKFSWRPAVTMDAGLKKTNMWVKKH